MDNISVDTVYPASTSVIAPFRVECDPRSPSFTPNSSDISLFSRTPLWNILMNCSYWDSPEKKDICIVESQGYYKHILWGTTQGKDGVSLGSNRRARVYLKNLHFAFFYIYRRRITSNNPATGHSDCMIKNWNREFPFQNHSWFLWFLSVISSQNQIMPSTRQLKSWIHLFTCCVCCFLLTVFGICL